MVGEGGDLDDQLIAARFRCSPVATEFGNAVVKFLSISYSTNEVLMGIPRKVVGQSHVTCLDVIDIIEAREEQKADNATTSNIFIISA